MPHISGQKKSLCGFILASCLLAGPVLAAAAEEIVARVNGQEISKYEFMSQLDGLAVPPASMQEIYPALLDKMIVSRILTAEGRASKLNESEAFKVRVKLYEEKLLADMAMREKLKNRITEDKVQAMYNDAVKKASTQDEVRARHILVKTSDEAAALITQLEAGADFAKLASEKSLDKGSSVRGGDLGYFAKGAAVDPVTEAAFAMKVGDYSRAPVKSVAGYHVIKLEDRRKAEFPKFEMIKGQLEKKLYDQMANEEVKNILGDAKIERFGLDGKPLLIKKD